MARAVGNILGYVVDVDFDENTNQLGFIRVKLAWNLDDPLRFQRNIQFQANENTIIKFRFERLRNFCTKCGSLKHDANECALTFEEDNPAHDDEGSDDNHQEHEHGERYDWWWLATKHWSGYIDTRSSEPFDYRTKTGIRLRLCSIWNGKYFWRYRFNYW